MASAAILKKTVKSRYLRSRLTDLDPIRQGDAYGHSGPYQTLKIALFRIQDGRRPPSWKIERSPYRNASTDLDEVWQNYANCVSEPYQLL